MRFERADPSCVPVHARRPRDEPRPSCLLRGTSARQRQNSARSRMIGRGMPISHSSAPFPKPIVASIHVWQVNAVAPPRFLAGPMRRTGASGAAPVSIQPLRPVRLRLARHHPFAPHGQHRRHDDRAEKQAEQAECRKAAENPDEGEQEGQARSVKPTSTVNTSAAIADGSSVWVNRS